MPIHEAGIEVTAMVENAVELLWELGKKPLVGLLSRSYSSQGSYETSYQSKYNYSYNYERSSSSVDRRDGRAFGLLNSSLELGNGSDNATLKVQGNNEAKGLAGSTLSAGHGADSISIDVLANGENSYQSRGHSSYQETRVFQGAAAIAMTRLQQPLGLEQL